MSKIKRNDPCPCGSGKKYKKCCMNKNVEGLGSVSLHEELNNHYSHLMAYVNRNYPNLAPLEQKRDPGRRNRSGLPNGAEGLYGRTGEWRHDLR